MDGIYIKSITQKLFIPIVENTVSAGFPSPAMDYIEKELDLTEYLIKHPASTFIVKVAGDSMNNSLIDDGDLVIVDRSLEAQTGDTVIAVVDGELTIKELTKLEGKYYLLPKNGKYKPIEFTENSEIWGVVTHIIHKLR